MSINQQEVTCNQSLKYSPLDTVHSLFETQVKMFPNNIALQCGSLLMSYSELNCKANNLAYELKQKGISIGDCVVILMDSSIEAIISIIAALKVGAVYVPLGLECPTIRVELILDDCFAKALLTNKNNSNVPKNTKIDVIFVDEFNFSENEKYKNVDAGISPNDLAYIIYTSGTTGRPKGVLLEHQSVNNYITWAANTYASNENSSFPFYTSISFDMTVTSIFVPLITGNKIIIYPTKGNELSLNQVLQDNKISILKLTPSHLRLIKNKKISNSNIRKLIVGGEQLGAELASDIVKKFGDVEIYNEYGPTETTVGSMIHLYDEENEKEGAVSIGTPIANTKIYILNQNLEAVPDGNEGEIYIAGTGLARGYLNHPELTNASFIENPFEPGTRMYKTGDIGVINNKNKQMSYLGRIDSQVKIRGYRIETSEIESKIEEYQKSLHTDSLKRITAPLDYDFKILKRCKICINTITDIDIKDFSSVCKTCREYEQYKNRATDYFSKTDQLFKLIKQSTNFGKGDYDCVLCFSGGKDSTYVLHKLVENGIRVLAFTFDNGYISKGAFENMHRATEMLGATLVNLNTKAIKEILVDSLLEESNVCNGCFKSINTIALQLAWKHNVDFVISGLSRGQIFEIDLHGLFKLGIFEEDAIEKRKIEYRQRYFAKSNRASRLLDADITEEMIDRIQFINYFRYDSVTTEDIIKYLSEKRRGWIKPLDTGSSSTNCRLNDASIYFNVKSKGDHFYTPQLSWEIRLGTISRELAFEEISSFSLEEKRGQEILNELDYYQPHTGAIVRSVDLGGLQGTEIVAYVMSNALMKISSLKKFIEDSLPSYMIPSYYIPIDYIPLTSIGKIDYKALPNPRGPEAPITFIDDKILTNNDVKSTILNIWSEILDIPQDDIALDVDFFDQGGHSFRFVMMVARLQEIFKHEFQLNLSNPTTVMSLIDFVTNFKKN